MTQQLYFWVYIQKKKSNSKTYLYPNAHGCFCLGAKWCLILSRHRGLFITWQDTLSMGFPRQEYWREKKRILEWVVISFPKRPSQPRDWTYLSWTAGGFFTTEPPGKSTPMLIATLFTVSKMWKQPTCPSTGEQIMKMWYIHTME